MIKRIRAVWVELEKNKSPSVEKYLTPGNRNVWPKTKSSREESSA